LPTVGKKREKERGMEMQEMRVQCCGVEGTFDALVPAERWNGWLAPRFKAEDVQKIVDAADLEDGTTFAFDGKTWWEVTPEGKFEMGHVSEDGRVAFGAWAWCWEEAA
jgi:hypothetical protein